MDYLKQKKTGGLAFIPKLLNDLENVIRRRYKLLKNIHELEKNILKEFAVESKKNLHIESIDTSNPLTSIYRVLLSDIVSSQIKAENRSIQFIIPSRTLLYSNDSNTKDNTYAYFELTEKGIQYIQNKINEILSCTGNDKEIEKRINEFRVEILYQSSSLFNNNNFIHFTDKDIIIVNEIPFPSDFHYEVEFTNKDYSNIPKSEQVNYVLKVKYKITGIPLNINKKEINGFFTKMASISIFTKKNKQNYIEIENQATKAAISQVMARNTSHNIGAHVMNKLTNADFLEKFCSYSHCLESYKPDKDFEDTKEHRAFEQIAIFNNYVKCRMDYLADISFGTPMMQTNKNASELFSELDKVRLLLEHITGLAGYEYKIEFKKNGIEKISNENDLLVAIPNDILGMQALYNIIENIIRNTAKHSKKVKKDEITIFTINFIDELTNPTQEQTNILNDLIAVEIYDNINIEGNAEQLSEPDKTEYLDKTKKQAPNELSKIDYLVFNQNKKLNEDILDENKLRSSSLGLIEMDASTTYLRKRDVSYINHKSYDLAYDESWSRDSELNKDNRELLRGTNCRHFLKAFKKENGKESYLGYRFFLLRPVVVLVVSDLLEGDKKNERRTRLKKQGIWVVTQEEFSKNLGEGKVYNHEFVLYANEDNPIIKKIFEKYKTSLPIRELSIDKNELVTLLTQDETQGKTLLEIFEDFCWKRWNDNNYNEQILILNAYKASNNQFQAVFLDHLYDKSDDIQRKNDWCENKDAKYIEALSNIAQSKLPDFNKILKNNSTATEIKNKFKDYLSVLYDNKDFIAYKQISEAVMTKIIVIDERIQEAAENRDFMAVLFKDLYQKMNVIVPDKETDINLSKDSFDKIFIEEVEKYIIGEINKTKPTDFILIHYSILERMYKKEYINTKLDEWIDNNKINIVITSGRGIPDNLTDKVRFVNLSSVISTFIDIRSKYAINYLLNSSRKSNKI